MRAAIVRKLQTLGAGLGAVAVIGALGAEAPAASGAAPTWHRTSVRTPTTATSAARPVVLAAAAASVAPHGHPGPGDWWW